MFDVRGWFKALWSTLLVDDEACRSMIQEAGGEDRALELFEGELTQADALAYARTLVELGHGEQAHELLLEVVRVAFDRAKSCPTHAAA